MTIVRFAAAILPLLAAVFASPPPARGADGPPAWAYPITPPDFKPAPDDGVPRRVPNSSATYTLTQIRDRFIAPVWHPEDHPPLPPVVAHGRKPDVFACGFCHRADGPGGPENSALAGLPAGYIVQQMNDYKSGARRTAACVTCHGPDLRGVGLIPGIAGRSTNYVVRQLYDIRHGFRAGVFAVLMKDVVAKLAEEDMLAIAAYLATQAP